MRHKRGGTKLGRLTAHRWALFRNLLAALFQHERITTTVTKAKALRPLAERLVSLAKQDTLHARRQVLTLVPDPVVVRRMFDSVAARYGDRRGGYVRIVPTGTRRGDGAPLAIVELVDRPQPGPDDKKAARAKRKSEPTGKAAKKARKAAAAAATG